jgi:hypothetical protein
LTVSLIHKWSYYLFAACKRRMQWQGRRSRQQSCRRLPTRWNALAGSARFISSRCFMAAQNGSTRRRAIHKRASRRTRQGGGSLIRGGRNAPMNFCRRIISQKLHQRAIGPGAAYFRHFPGFSGWLAGAPRILVYRIFFQGCNQGGYAPGRTLENDVHTGLDVRCSLHGRVRTTFCPDRYNDQR